MSRTLGVLISGRGSNLQAIIDAIARGDLVASIGVVVSNRADAAGLVRAREAGIATACILPGAFGDRDGYDGAVASELKAHGVDVVCLAGYMRLVGRRILDAFPNRVLNIHPSLLPSFPGLHAQKQALDHGVRVSGATVHLVTDGLDEGPIILQSAVPVLASDDESALAARILAEEHRLYPRAIDIVLAGGWRIEGRRFVSDRVRSAFASSGPA